MKTAALLLALVFCHLSVAQLQDSDEIRVNDITQQLDYQGRESRAKEIPAEEQAVEAEATVDSQQTCQSSIYCVLREMRAAMAEQKAELTAVGAKLRASESQVEELNRDLQGNRLRSTQMIRMAVYSNSDDCKLAAPLLSMIAVFLYKST